MYTITRRYALLSLASLFALAVSVPAAAGSKKFTESDDAKQNDEPQEYLKDYDKLTKGKEADWVYFTEGVDLKSFKTVSLKTWGTTNKHSRSKRAAESGPEYLEQWIKRSKKLGWDGREGRWRPADRRERLQCLGAERRRPRVGRLGGESRRGDGARRQGQVGQDDLRDPPQGEGLHDGGCRRERPREHRQDARGREVRQAGRVSS